MVQSHRDRALPPVNDKRDRTFNGILQTPHYGTVTRDLRGGIVLHSVGSPLVQHKRDGLHHVNNVLALRRTTVEGTAGTLDPPLLVTPVPSPTKARKAQGLLAIGP